MSHAPALLLTVAALAALPAAALAKGPLPEPDEGPDPRGLTLMGVGTARVEVPRSRTETSIERAVQAAQPAAVARAVRDARGRARALGAAAGLTLGGIVAVAERNRELEQGFVPTQRWCRRDRRSRRLRCNVPASTSATVAVTFATAQTSAAVPAGRAVTAPGTATAAVRPRDRRSSPSIARALLGARAAATPGALVAARRAAAATALAAGLPLGPLFSVAEVRRSFEDFSGGSFGPGRWCGFVRRPIFRRDPATGRRRVVRRVRTRRCFFSRQVAVALRVTFVPPSSAA
jgi:hypothetical protein